MAKISILIPAFNCEKYIKEAINSILNQTYKDFEVIIVNDGSTDKTHDIIKTFSDPRIKYYQNPVNEGLNNVRNKLVGLSSANILAFLDSDDIAEPNRIELEYATLMSHPEICLVAGSVRSLEESGRSDSDSWRFDLAPEKLKVHLLFYNPIVTSAVMFRKDKLPDEIFRSGYPPCEDYDLWVRMLLNGKGVVLPEILATYRLYYNSVSKRKAYDARHNRNKVILDQLEYYFSKEYNEEEKLTHLSLVEFEIKNSLEDIKDLKDWINKLISLNIKYRHFEESILKQVLYERVLKRFLRLDAYNFTVFKTLMEIKKELQPALTLELRKKETAILVFALVGKKFISTG